MHHHPSLLLARWQRLPWPLPALLTWAAGWLLWLLAGALGLAPAPGFGAALLATLALAAANAGRWRQGMAAAGFPLSAAALGAAHTLPPWVWLLLLLPVLVAYPLRAWRDAPFFPTPANALQGLDTLLPIQPRSALDAGCGLGHGLAALHRLWPQAQLCGLEWSPLLARAAALRCGFAQVRRADMWAAPWAGQELVYVFQRPESMARVFAKAQRELAPEAWLVSLEFEVPDQAPFASLHGPGRRPLWVYRMPSRVIKNSTTGDPGR